MKRPPSPTEFASKMRDIHNKYANEKEDYEGVHTEMDDYICKTLEALGYKEGVMIFRTEPKLYC
jgi:hypothetical protein